MALMAAPAHAVSTEPAVGEAAPAPGPTPEERTAAFKPYDDAMQTGQKAAAADALLPILDDPTLAALHGEAWLKMGDLLAGFDMEYSALIAYTHAIDADPATAATKVSAAMDLADEMGDTRLIAPALAKNVGISVDSETRSRMAFLAARHFFQEGGHGTALGILGMVDKDAAAFPRAEALRGVVLAQQGQANDALAPLLTAQAMADKTEDPARFRDVMALNLGRSYYTAGNFAQAITYFAQVSRGSVYWPEAEFERAWSHFRLDDMNGTLGLLENHASPFFEGWYFPEASMLRTYSLFLLCKFPAATESIDGFTAHYGPVREELDRTLAAMTPEEAWADVRAFLRDEPTRLPAMVLRPYRAEDRINGALQSIEKAEEELGRLQNASANPFTERANARLKARRDAIVQAEGERVLAQARVRRDELQGYLDNVQITKLDMMSYETQLYEKAAATGALEFGDRIGELRKLRKAKGTRVWPFQDEYWADELGYYRYDVRPDCPAGMAAGESP
jgi:tetratricopeptide (TPR) repeat protein